ncbi:hypothetical protein [Roseivivax sp. CAU 1753]
MTYMNPLAATQIWMAWTNAFWMQQLKMAQIMSEAAQQNGKSVFGIDLPTVVADDSLTAAQPRKRPISPRVMRTIAEADKSRKAARKPSALPEMPPRRTHATPV